MEKSFFQSAILTAVIVLTVVTAWELTLRHQGYVTDYDNSPALWANERAKVYQGADKSVVFIGASRIKYGLDIPTFENTTGLSVVQLAIEGSTCRTILDDLANDVNFKGRLIVDVTELIIFSNSPFFFKKPTENLKYYHKHTPAEQASFYVNNFLESQFVFLDKDNLSLNAQLNALEIPSRKGVFMMPTFPADFDRGTFARQSYMANSFVNDTTKQQQVQAIWEFLGKGLGQGAPMPDAELNAIFESIKTATDKIKARGGDVIFVRTPCSGLSLGELKGFPREKYWERLLNYTHCQGIHFTDYTATNHFICPEFSHLKPTDAVIYTQSLIQTLDKDKGWVMNAGNRLVVKK